MANQTDPLVSQLAGSDPQNLLEYITRQHIYDSRYWKETCFGLNVADTLVEATKIQSIGSHPCHFLALTLKLLQLRPETDLVIESFIEQDSFKYVRALGFFYLRLTAKPVEIYTFLEDHYKDSRKLRSWEPPYWKLVHMDTFLHSLLTESRVVGVALPRLVSRAQLVEAGYLSKRVSPLQAMIDEHHNGDAVCFLKHKALIEEYPPAIDFWNKRNGGQMTNDDHSSAKTDHKVGSHEPEEAKRIKPKKKKTKYGSLFKKDEKKIVTTGPTAQSGARSGPQEGSTEYWNEQRQKLGLKPLKE